MELGGGRSLWLGFSELQRGQDWVWVRSRKLERQEKGMTRQGRSVTKASGHDRVPTGPTGLPVTLHCSHRKGKIPGLFSPTRRFSFHPTPVSPRPSLCTRPVALLQPHWPFCCPQAQAAPQAFAYTACGVWSLFRCHSQAACNLTAPPQPSSCAALFCV